MLLSPQSAFRALSDPTRRDILQLLSDGEMTVAEVSDHFDMTRAAVKKHLNILEEGKLITTEMRGRERFNRLNAPGLRPVQTWLSYFDRFWDDKLSDLQDIFTEKDASHD